MLLNLIGISGIFGFIIFIIYRFRSDGAAAEKIKTQEAINDQNDELLEYLRKQKDFIHRMRSGSADDRKRLLDKINNPEK